jgi:hypothetical protein
VNPWNRENRLFERVVVVVVVLGLGPSISTSLKFSFIRKGTHFYIITYSIESNGIGGDEVFPKRIPAGSVQEDLLPSYRANIYVLFDILFIIQTAIFSSNSSVSHIFYCSSCCITV